MRRFGFFLTAALMLASCATARKDRADIPEVNFDRPLGTEAASSAAAARHLPLQPRQPVGLGKPVRIVITDPRTTPRRDRAVAYVFHDPGYGRFFVRESASTVTQDQLEQLASCQPGETGCSTEGWALVTIRGGITGLLIYAPPERSVATSITWLEDGVEYVVMGPRDSLTGDQAIHIANSV